MIIAITIAEIISMLFLLTAEREPMLCSPALSISVIEVHFNLNIPSIGERERERERPREGERKREIDRERERERERERDTYTQAQTEPETLFNMLTWWAHTKSPQSPVYFWCMYSLCRHKRGRIWNDLCDGGRYLVTSFRALPAHCAIKWWIEGHLHTHSSFISSALHSTSKP